MSNELTKIIEKEKLPITQSEFILKEFQTIFEKAKEYELKAREIKVTDISQVAEMKKARTIRLELKNLRVEANKKKVDMKEDSLRTGRAIQGIYNCVEALIVPMEEYLEKQEKFAENIEKEKRLKKYEERINVLSKFVLDTSVYNLQEMSEAGFQELLKASELVYNQRIEETQRVEAARLKREEEDRIENERIRFENNKLKEEQKIKDDLIAKQNKEKADLIAKQQKELADEKKKRDEQDAKFAKEEEKRQEEISKRNAIKIQEEIKIAEEKRKAELAPDKDKLINLSNDYANFKFPEVGSEQANAVLKQVRDLSTKIALYIIKQANNL